MRDVYHVQQQVSLARLVERRLERVDQVGGQLAYEADGVGKQERQVVYHHLAHRGVERGEQLVLGEHLALCEHVHDGRFAHVGISHERHTYGASAVLALSAHLLVNLHEALLEQRDAVEDDTAVHLELRLTRSAQTHGAFAATGARATALTLKVRPQALQTRQHVAILRQFHLRLCGSRLRAHGEDVEDERRAVEYLHLQYLLDVAYLLRRQLVVEDNHADGTLSVLLSLYVFAYLLQLTRTHVRHRAWSAHALCEALHGYGARRVGEKLQLVEIFLCLCLVLILRYQTDKNGCLSLYFRYYKFFHSGNIKLCLGCAD